MDLGLRGRAVLVTGGSRGIGLRIALDAAAEGARVAICGRDPDALAAAAERLRATGADVLTLRSDLSQPDAPARLVEETVSGFGTIDVLVNNASADVAHVPALSSDADDEGLLSRIGGKLIPAIRCSRAAIGPMTRAGGGRIVMIGGTAARAALGSATGVPSAGAAAAGLGNAALVNFAKHLSLEVAPVGILVNVVHPGVVATDRHPARLQQVAERMGSTVDEAAQWFDAGVPIGRTIVPEDVSGIVLFLASQRAAGITGQTIAVDGGALPGVNY